MKYLTYIVTFLAYTTVHVMRMSLPFVQLSLMDFFGIHKFEMGVANACLYILIGLSYLWRAVRPMQAPHFTYFWTMIASSLFFMLIPLLVFLNVRAPALLYISLAGFGWFQSAAWPVLLSLVHEYFLPHRDGALLGLWSANGDTGNIVGFLMCTLVVYGLKLPFQICLLVAAVYGLVMAVAVYKLGTGKQAKGEIVEEGYTQRICAQYTQIVKDKIVVFMIIMLCMLKGILYGILLWLPMYFDQSGFKQYEGYIPISMNIAAIAGSVALGLVYQKVASKAIRATIFMVTLLVTVVTFYLIKAVEFSVENRLVLLLLICMIGFCVMGNFNILSAHEVSAACERLNFSIAAFSSLVMAMGNIFVGIIQFIIGRAATDDSNSVFLIFFIMSIVLVVLEVLRASVLWYDRVLARHNQGEGHSADGINKSSHRNSEVVENEEA